MWDKWGYDPPGSCQFDPETSWFLDIKALLSTAMAGSTCWGWEMPNMLSWMFIASASKSWIIGFQSSWRVTRSSRHGPWTLEAWGLRSSSYSAKRNNIKESGSAGGFRDQAYQFNRKSEVVGNGNDLCKCCSPGAQGSIIFFKLRVYWNQVKNRKIREVWYILWTLESYITFIKYLSDCMNLRDVDHGQQLWLIPHHRIPL